jgi:guanylate kinase
LSKSSLELSADADKAAGGTLVIISGPSGVGKSTIAKEVLKRMKLDFSVSVTTRKPRPGEVDGKDYHFVGRSEFERMAKDGELLEWADVFGNCYGTPAGPVKAAVAAGRTILLEIDVQGGLQVARKMPQAVFVLIVPPNEQELAQRLGGRGSEDEKTQARRLAKAKSELAVAQVSGIYKHYVVNNDLEETIQKIMAIIKQESGKR